MRKGLASQRLIAVFLIAVPLFNFPLLFLFDQAGAFFGLPAVFVYLFASWAALIAAMAWIAERGPR